MVLALIIVLLLDRPLTQRIFQIRCRICIGRRRPMLAIVAMRGLSTSTAAILAATLRATIFLFGWCVSDSEFENNYQI